MNENERLKSLRKSLGLTQTEMAEKIGIKQGSYSDVERGKAIVSNYVKMSLEQNLNLNRAWLETGKGEMLNKDHIVKEEGSSIARLMGKQPPSLDFLRHKLNKLYESDNFDTEVPSAEITLPGYDDCEMIFGDAMAPSFCNGDVVLIKEWKDVFVEFGQAYLIVTNNDHRMARILLPDDENGSLICKAINDKYPPVKIARSDIKKLCLIKGKVEWKSI